jgi:Domain of unknown function (DUF4382)
MDHPRSNPFGNARSSGFLITPAPKTGAMKKTNVAAITIAAALIVALAAAAVILQNQPSQSGSGQLSIMGTDPAIAASGVSDSTIHYSSVSAHRAGSDMASGWAQVSGSGTLDLMATQGTAQTIATSTVGAGAYDAFRLNVDSAQVTYQGHQYTATVASTTLTAQSQSKVQVNSSADAAAVVDLRTFIMNTGSTSSPQFIFSATAVAASVPPQALTSISLQLGASADLSAQAWWSTFVSQTTTNVVFTGSLSSGSMALNLQNSGSAQAYVQEVVVTPASATAFASTSLPASFSGSAVFMVGSSGTLQQSTSLQTTALLAGGATVSSGASTTLSFNGNIALNFDSGTVQVTGVLAGQQYLVTVIGANTYASALVVAS